jgi:tetratricopeptide (TPR) repeat protein
MTHRSAIIFFILLIPATCIFINLSGMSITATDTALVNDLLRKGQKLHDSKPDSAIYYYRRIIEKADIKAENLSSSMSDLEKSYLETVIKALNYSGDIYYYNDEYNRSEPYYQKSLLYAGAAGLKDDKARALFDIGYIRYVNNDYSEAAQLFEQSYSIYAETGNKKGMYNVRQACGLTYRRLGDYAKADSCYKECLQFALSQQDSMKLSDTRINYGILWCEQGKLDEGINMFEEALSYYEQTGNEEAVSTALLNIGVVLKMVNEYDKALAYIKRSTEIEEFQQQKSQLVVRYFNLADLYLDMGKNNKAYDYCMKIQSVANDIGSHPFTAECAYLFGRYYYLENDFPTARGYFKAAAESAHKTNDMPLITNIDLWYARTSLKDGDLQSTVALAQEAYKLADHLHLLMVQKEASGLLSQAYERTGDDKSALHWYKIFITHSDSLSYFNQRQEISRIEAKYNYEKKEKENEILRDKASLQEQRLRIRNIISIALIAVVILSIIIILLLNRRNKDAKLLYEQQQMLNLQHLEEIEGELDGKKRELTSKMMFLNQKNELIGSLIKRLQEIQHSPDTSSEELVSIVNELRVDAPQSNWKEFETHFTQVHPGFYQRLYEKHPDLTSYELRICAFLRMNLNTKEIAAITGRSPKSIEVARSRIRQKLDLRRDDNLSSFLAAI